jgi:transcription elongation GreA/GreB family factor
VDKRLKKSIVEKIISQLERDLELLVQAATIARDAAVHEESKAEDKYDTRGLEASYLAGAQAKRAAEIEQLLFNYRQLELLDFDDSTPIATTALVELELEGGRRRGSYFLVPKGGAMTVELEARKIQVITVASPLGQELLGREQGDEFELVTPTQKNRYLIKSLA